MEKQINEESITDGSSMHCSIRGWVFALMVAERCHQAAGGGTIPVGPVNHDRGLREAFVRHPLSQATRGLNKRTGHRTCDVLEGTSRRGSGLLRAKKKSRDNDVEDYREAAKVLDQMERRREKKTQERARRREANKTPPQRNKQSDGHGEAGGVVSKMGSNPFKKEKIVSKFDVNDVRKVEFVGSFQDNESEWPKTTLPEIAFLGRSNVGKSSMLNTLFGEAVAKVSKTPGRTRHINIFKAKNSKGKDVCYFADLPGYGYAKMGKDKQRSIETFLEMYLERRSNLKLLILLTDPRREPLLSDAGILEYAQDNDSRRYKILVVATKVDKLNVMESTLNVKRLQEAFHLPPGLPVSFSAITGQGKKEIWGYIRQAAAS